MTKEQINSYTLRISEANESQYVVILHEILIDFLDEAIIRLQNNQLDEYLILMKKCQRINAELRNQMNTQVQEGRILIREYDKVGSMLVKGILRKELEPTESAKNMLGKLKPGFVELSKKDQSSPILGNTQKVYEGLTYGRGAKNETYIDGGSSGRGFTV